MIELSAYFLWSGWLFEKIWVYRNILLKEMSPLSHGIEYFSHLYFWVFGGYFSRAAVTNHHRLGCLRLQKELYYTSGGSKFNIRVLAGPFSPQRLEGERFPDSPSSPSAPQLAAASLQPHLCLSQPLLHLSVR